MNFKLKMFTAAALVMLLPASGKCQPATAEDLRQDVINLRMQIDEIQQEYAGKIQALEQQIEAMEQRHEATVSAQVPAAAPPARSSLATLPDISVIGNITGYFGDEMDNRVYMDEVELALGGYIFPGGRADVIIALDRHGDHYDVELEEAYVSFFNLPGGFGIQAGKKLIDFGKINPIHGHHYPFVDEPLASEKYLGDHGLSGNGVSVNYLFPFPFFLQGSVGYWELAGHDCHGHGHGHSLREVEYDGDAFNARLWSSFPIGDSGELEIGGSYLRAKGDHHFDSRRDVDRIDLYGLDLTYTHAGIGFRRLLLRSELYFLQGERFRPYDPGPPERSEIDAKYERYGLYSLLNYRWDQYWDAGLRYDWLQNPTRHNDDDYHAFSVFATRSLTETTKLRGQASYHTENDDWRFYVQALFGIGPHAHPLE